MITLGLFPYDSADSGAGTFRMLGERGKVILSLRPQNISIYDNFPKLNTTGELRIEVDLHTLQVIEIHRMESQIMTRLAWLRSMEIGKPVPWYVRVFAEVEWRVRYLIFKLTKFR